MYLLGDSEIESLGRAAEKFILNQRIYKSYLIASSRGTLQIIDEVPETLAIHLLKNKFPDPRWYMQDDVKRLAKTIANNVSNMDWCNNLN